MVIFLVYPNPSPISLTQHRGERVNTIPFNFTKIMRQKGTKTPPLPYPVALRGISVFITIGN